MKAVIALKAEHRLEVLLEVARLARSTFFYHQARLARPDPQAELKTAITSRYPPGTARQWVAGREEDRAQVDA